MNRELYAIGGLVLAVLCLIPSCKKDKDSFSFKENFEVVYNLTSRGWIFQNNSIPSDAGAWRQGITTDTKSTSYGFNAYNKKSSDDEYAFAGYYSFSPVTGSISSWMFTPAVEVKNGDHIIFYTRVDNDFYRLDRLQVRLNETDNSTNVGTTPESTGNFTKLMLDINPGLTMNGYPSVWSRYDITVSGLAARKNTRIAFRYMGDPQSTGGVGLDAFEFIDKK